MTISRVVLPLAAAALLSACAYDGYDAPRPDDRRGEGNPGREGKPGENKLVPAPGSRGSTASPNGPDR
jgi:hypothetical protein